MQAEGSNWQDLRPRERMEHLLKTGHLSDCSFVVYHNDGNKIILKCHKFVLMNVSPVFERMFEGDFEEAKAPDNIVLDDVSGAAFKKFIEYLYWHDNRRLELYEMSMLQTMIYLSKKFMVSFMTTNCLNAIKRRLNSGMDENETIDLFEYAHQIENADLIRIITTKFHINSMAYINAAAVFDLSSEIFLNFIKAMNGHVGDKIRFDVIDRYCKIQGLVINSDRSLTSNTLSSVQDEDDYLQTTKRMKSTTLASDTKIDIQNIGEIDKEKQEVADKKDENENNVKNDIGDSEEQTTKDNIEKENKTQREQQQKEEYISKLLDTIKFTSMSPFDFCVGPGSSNLLSVEKKYDVLSTICVLFYKLQWLSASKSN